MDYDFRNKPPPAYDPPHRPSGTSLYPRVGSHGPIPQRSSSSFQQQQMMLPPVSSSNFGMGIRVVIKPEYLITPPPQMLPQVGDIPRSNFQYDFEFERKVLAEAEKESPNWGRLVGMDHIPPRTAQSVSSSSLGPTSTIDPIAAKYIASGLSREAVNLAIANYGDNATKVREFVNAYNILREMGFQSNSVAKALAMYDNDTDKALAYFLNSST